MSKQNRRHFLQQTGAAIGAFSAEALQSEASVQRGADCRPNLVYVFADQLRYFSCGYAGDEHARTPNIDRLAQNGCNLRNAISSTPVCAPHRASLMTGKYQSSTGMVINELRLSPEHDCFGAVLKRRGYRTAYIGKWHLWANELGHHELTRNGFVPPGAYRLGFDDFWAAYNFNHTYHHSPYFLNNTDRHYQKQFEPIGQTDMAIDYIRRAKQAGHPFALFLSWGPPHDPWDWSNVPAEHADVFRRAELPLRPNYSDHPDPYCDAWQTLPPNYSALVADWQRAYYAQTLSIDANVGRLQAALDEAGLSDNTIFVFTSDHGEMFGSHGRRAKYIFYEEAARVPFLVRWPGHIPKGSLSDALLGTPDIMPTLLSLMNVPVPQSAEGEDLSQHILGKGGRGPDAAHLQGMGATAAWTDGSEWRALRDHEFTYAIYHRDRKELLFHNARDPFQLKDLAQDRHYAATLKHLRARSEHWRKQRNDTFEACSWYRDRWAQNRNIITTATGVGQSLTALQSVLTRWFPDSVGDRTS